jgi:hypothetical protein
VRLAPQRRHRPWRREGQLDRHQRRAIAPGRKGHSRLGDAGQLLHNMLKAIELKPESDVYVTNWSNAAHRRRTAPTAIQVPRK